MAPRQRRAPDPKNHGEDHSGMKPTGRFSTTVLAWLALTAGAAAQTYPSRPIHMLVAYPSAGANDLLARVVGQKLSDAWGQPVVGDNQPGAHRGNGTRAAKDRP